MRISPLLVSYKRLTRDRTGDILVEHHDHLNREIRTCRDVSKRLRKSIEMVQEAADLAKTRKADMLARQQRRAAQLELLHVLVRKKEEEVRHFV